MRSAVFLDRDGVLSRALIRDGKAYAPRRVEDFRLLPNASKSVDRLKGAGFLVIVVTNQPDIGNGLVASEVVEEMHRRLQASVAVDAVLVCPHRQSDGCSCRKPRAGLLLIAAKRFQIDLPTSYMVGDRTTDVDAGRAAGCRTVFIDRRYAEGGPEHVDASAGSLEGATAYILSRLTREDSVAKD